MALKQTDSTVKLEDRILLAVKAYQNGQFRSIRAAAAAYDVPHSTLAHRIKGRKARTDIPANCQKLSSLEEASLKKWILDMDERGLPPTHAAVRKMADLLLHERKGEAVSERWITRFIKRHDELISKYTRKYDYQRAKCEDPEVINQWFNLVQNTIIKYGILEQDIYNFDETGFQMGVASTAKVITASRHRTSRVRAVQPGNREWVTVIESINASGWSLPPMIIFSGKVHQSQWYQDIDPDWVIGLSDNGWTNNELGLFWLEKIFEKHTATRTLGRYWLLILDGHASHESAEFDLFCKNHQIVPLYMPSHSSDKLQPLDVACFAPLKEAYGAAVMRSIQNGIHHIDKENFLDLYKGSRKALSSKNIRSGFEASGLVPLNPQRVLDKLTIKNITPPNTAHGPPEGEWIAKTPYTSTEVQKQMELIKQLVNRNSQSPPTEAIRQLAKAAETTMHEVILLRHQVIELRAANKRQKQKRAAPRSYIATGGVLTGSEGQQLAQEALQAMDLVEPIHKKRAPPRCSNCHQIGHIRTSCPSRTR
jgi:hypothetical protein